MSKDGVHKRGTRVLALLLAIMLMAGISPLGFLKVSRAQGNLPSELFISEYIEGASFNKAIEIYNGTGHDVNLSEYSLELYPNGSSTSSKTMTLSGTLTSEDTYVICHGSANQEIKNKADAVDSNVINFNGDDALVLKHNGTIVDVIGQVGTDPGSSWGAGDTTTVDHTLLRKSSITSGDTNPSDAFDPALEWDSYPKDTFTYLGSHTMGGTLPSDTTPPSLLSKAPGDNATGVASDAEISLTFDENIQPGENVAAIEITYDADKTVSDVVYSISGSKLIIGHPNLPSGTVYTVTVPQGAVKDLAGNANAQAIRWSFTTEGMPVGSGIQNPSFELPGTNGAKPSVWTAIYMENETHPYKLNTQIFDASGQYPPPLPIPDGQFAARVYYQVGSDSGLIGAGLEQTDAVFGTIDDKKDNTLIYSVVQTYYPSPKSASFGGAVVEVEFESAGETYKLRYFHKFSADYTSQPVDQDHVKYVISTPFSDNNLWQIGVQQHLNQDIQDKFGLTTFTVKALRLVNVVNRTASSPYPNSTTYWDNVRIERAGEDTQAPSISDLTVSTPQEIGKDLTISAKVTDNYRLSSVKLFYKMEGEKDFTEKDMTLSEGQKYSCVISGALIKAGTLAFHLEAKDGQNNAARYPVSGEETVTISSDQSPPVISQVSPEDGTKVFSKRPQISARYEDSSGINLNSVKLYIKRDQASYTEVTSSSSVTSDRITFTPGDLADGQYWVKVELSDNAGKSAQKEWSFTVSSSINLQHFAGTTHNHTKISHDGTGELEAAIAAAKANGYDWFTFSDHSHDIDPEARPNDSVDHNGDGLKERTGGPEWQKTKSVADQYTANGQFVVFAGHEMTSTTWGHANILGLENFIDRIQENGAYQNLSNMYKWVESHPEAVASFNHPYGGEFSDFTYDPKADEVFNIIEVGNASGHYSYTNFEQKYWEVLDKGWHVAPVYGEDNHDATWGETEKRTVVLAPELTREALLDAMRNHRVYMSEDKNFRLNVWANGEPMGAKLSSNDIAFEITGTDPDGNDEITQVSLITNTGKVIDSLDPEGASFTWKPQITGTPSHWYVVKVTQADGQRIYSSPVWTRKSEVAVRLSGLALSPQSAVKGHEVTVSATVSNAGFLTVSGLTIDFYKGSVSQENEIGKATPKSLTPGQTDTVSVKWIPQETGRFSIIAVLTVAGDSDPDVSDNRASALLEVKEPLGKVVMIDYGHGNDYASDGSYSEKLGKLEAQLITRGYAVVRNGAPNQDDLLTRVDLENVDVLILTEPSASKDLTDEENKAVADFVKAGGGLFYTGKGSHNNDPTIENDLLALSGTKIRVNYDNVYESVYRYQGTSPWAVLATNMPCRDTVLNILRDRVGQVRYYSGASLTDADMKALTTDDGVEILLKANPTSYQNDQKGYRSERTFVYQNPAEMPLVAVEDLPGTEGKVAVSGRGFFSDFEYGARSGNETLALNIIDWLAGLEVPPSEISQARREKDDTHLVIKGTVASDAGVFFDAFYVQDETGGIMAFKEVPDDADLKVGDIVRVYGKIKTFEGNREIEFEQFNRDVVKVGKGSAPVPKECSTGASTADSNQGLLVKVKGRLVQWYSDDCFYLDDGTGRVLVFTDGYIVNKTGPLPEGLSKGKTVEVIGFAGKFSGGTRIRVRNTAEVRVVPDEVTPPDEEPEDAPSTETIPPGATPPVSDGIIDEALKGAGEKRSIQITAAQGSQALGFTKTQIERLTKESVNLELRVGQVRLVVPKEVLGALASAGSDISHIQVEAKPLPKDVADSVVQEAKNKGLFKIGSQVFELDLLLYTKDGRKERLETFPAPIRVALPIPEGEWAESFRLAIARYNDEKRIWEPLDSRYDEASGTVVAETNHFSKYALLKKPVKSFPDILGHWAQRNVEIIATMGIVHGVSEDAFMPDAKVTRAQFATMLVRMLDAAGVTKSLAGESGNGPSSDMPFRDVAGGTWYYENVRRAYHLGLVKGISDDLFCPGAEITRQEMASMVGRTMAKLGHPIAPEGKEAVSGFVDGGDVAEWALDSVAGMVKAGLMVGRDANRLEPTGKATRAEGVTLIKRVLEKVGMLSPGQ